MEKVRKKTIVMSLNEAMRETIKECIEEGVLLEFFREYGEEMIAMEWYEVTQEMIWEIQREEALADAREEGLRQGIERGIAQGIAQARMESEQVILLLKQEIAKLKEQLAAFQ